MMRPRRWLGPWIIVALAVAVAIAAPANAESRQPARHGARHASHPYSREIAEAAARHAVPERLLRAVIQTESGFNPRAVSRRGARGLMQLMPETAGMLGVRNSFDPRENIDAGARHLRALLGRFRNNLRLTLAAYNAGEQAVLAYGGVPPFPETREYVTQVLRLYGTPVEWREWTADGIYQVVNRDGSITYTNIPPGSIQRASAR
jgi:soluble lytic murein transglycosylase-like protein